MKEKMRIHGYKNDDSWIVKSGTTWSGIADRCGGDSLPMVGACSSPVPEDEIFYLLTYNVCIYPHIDGCRTEIFVDRHFKPEISDLARRFTVGEAQHREIHDLGELWSLKYGQNSTH